MTASRLNDWKPTRLKCLLIGESGTGKTTQAASVCKLPEVRSAWVASFDGGVASMRSAFSRLGIKDTDVEVETFIETNRQSPDAYARFQRAFAEVRKAADKDLIILDGFTFFTKYTFDYIVALNNLVDKKYGDMTFHLYRLLMDKVRDTITQAVTASSIVVATVLPQLEKDENSGDTFLFPDVEGKSSRQSLPGLFDEVYSTDIDNDPKGATHYKLVTSKQQKKLAKTRWGGGLLEARESRDLGDILGRIMEAYK